MKEPIQKREFSEVIALAERYPGVKLLYLFGSRARGEADSRSDFDFAIYIDASKEETRDTYLSFVGHLPKAIGSEEVDVVPLHNADRPELCYRILQEGKLLYEISPYRLQVEPDLLNSYYDFTLSQKTHFAL
jgi:predicted nucleotidyltransferase